VIGGASSEVSPDQLRELHIRVLEARLNLNMKSPRRIRSAVPQDRSGPSNLKKLKTTK
jgi:hypothetical protein